MALVIRSTFGLTLPLLLLVFVTRSNQQALLDQLDRDRDGSSITLQCRRESDLVAFPDADFWINDTTTPLDRSLYTAETEGIITFSLRPEQEGFFYCGSISQGIQSNSLELVAYPERSEDVDISYIVEVGNPVTLQCPYRPGALIQHYDYTWFVGNPGVLITDADPRYSIGGDLNINTTALSDESQHYQCRVQINNPRGNGWTRGSNFISLDIYERPSIVQFPARRVVLENQTTSVAFTCEVRGSPRPEISWQFNEVDVTEHEAAARFQDLSFDNGETVTHQLTINQLQGTDSGSIICVARTMEPEVFVVSSKTTLSVLTSNFVLETGITDSGDLQIRILLIAPIQDELQFRIRFIETGTERQRERTMEGNFINQQQSIFFRVPLIELPFSQFTVQVAMEVNGVVGDFTRLSMLLDTNEPNPLSEIAEPECDNNLFKITVPVIVGSIGILLLVIFLPIVVVCLKQWSKRKDHIKKTEDKVGEEIRQHPDNQGHQESCLEYLKIVKDGENEIEEDEEKDK